MPKHYCDYCDVFLTHDSTSALGHDKAQSIIDQITSAYESGGGPPPGGFGGGFGAFPPGPPPSFGMPPPGFGGPPPPGFGGPPPGFGGGKYS
ncbi:hypothetical protein HWV62_32742 [Athelia sp. TMB]|nr:hypothetical protein HWV62_32742 [Athelia sp. TMB]